MRSPFRFGSSSTSPGAAPLFINDAFDEIGVPLDIRNVPVNAENSAGTGAANDTTANVSASAGVAVGTGAANNPARVGAVTDVNPDAASGTGTANQPGSAVSVNAGVASGSGAAANASSFGYPFTAPGLSAVATVGSVTITVTSVPTPATIAATTSVGDPDTVGTIVPVATVSGTTTVGSPDVPVFPTPATVAALASIPLPVIHTSADGTTPGTTNRWSFYDPDTGQLYEFDINPSEQDYQPFAKRILYTNTLPRKSIIYEVQKDATTVGWSGTVLLQGQLAAFQSWFDNRAVVQLTDDLGRTFDIYITEFTPKRVRTRDFPWFHTYDMKALLV